MRHPDAVYIGRRNLRNGLDASPLYNPFSHRDTGYAILVGSREEAIRRFRTHVGQAMKAVREGTATEEQRALVEELERLADIYQETGHLKLGCWCAPKPCHGQIVANAVQYLVTQRQQA